MEFIDAGEQVVVVGSFTVRLQGSERAVTTPFAEIAEFRGALTARARWFTDTARMAGASGD